MTDNPKSPNRPNDKLISMLHAHTAAWNIFRLSGAALALSALSYYFESNWGVFLYAILICLIVFVISIFFSIYTSQKVFDVLIPVASKLNTALDIVNPNKPNPPATVTVAPGEKVVVKSPTE